MALNRLSRGEQILGGAGLLLFIVSFIKPWASVDEGLTFIGVNYNLWDGYGFLPKLGVLVAFLLAVLVVAKAAGALDRANLPVPLGLVYLGGAAIVVLTMLLALLAGPEGDNAVFDRGIFLWVGLLLTAALAAGAFLHFSGGEATAGTTAGRTGGPPSVPPGT